MRARNREVNIFNMSLLDILTGMLGAFLFLMLGLVPYYTRAKNAAQSQDQQQQDPGTDTSNRPPPVDTVLNVVGQWTSSAAVDLFLLEPDGSWRGPHLKSVPLARLGKITNNSCSSDVGWQADSVYANAGDRFLFAFSPQPDSPAAAPQALMISFDLTEIEGATTKGAGLTSYYQDMACGFNNVSAAQPGHIYGLYWITVQKDESKDKYDQQYSLQIDRVHDARGLPRGVEPAPAAPGNPAAPEAPTTPTNPPPAAKAPPHKSWWSPFSNH